MEKDVFFPRRELPLDFQNEVNINGFSFAFELSSAPDGRPQAKSLQCMGGAVAAPPQPSAGMDQLGQHATGHVKSFSPKGGYGFITMLAPATGDIFFAKRDLPLQIQDTNLIGVHFEFDIGSSNDGRTQAKNLICMDPSSGIPPKGAGKGDAMDGSRLLGQIREINQEGGIIICSTFPEELSFTPNDLPAVWQRKVMSGEVSPIQKASVLFTLAVAQGRSFAKEVMIIPDPEELLVGEVVQFNPSAGYGFIRPIAESVFQQDVYFNIKDLARPFTDQERMGLIGMTCRFNLRLTPDNRPQGRRVEMVSSSGATPTPTVVPPPKSRFSYEAPATATSVLQPGAVVGVPEDYDPAKYAGAALLQGEKRPAEAVEESASKRQAVEQVISFTCTSCIEEEA